jgi:uncharacterized protein involved in type VI secretion and phage assembly
MIHAPVTDGQRPAYFGLYPALVTDIVDPDKIGRIEVEFPWLSVDDENDVRAWATLLSPYADKEQGFQFLPEKGSQVVVGFEAGDARRPYIVGACWNGKEALPDKPKEANNIRVIKTRSKSQLEFDDTEGAAKITLSTSAGHKLILDEEQGEVTLTHSNGCTIKMTQAGVIEIQANSSVDVTAGVLNVHAGTANFDGVINCTTLVAKSSVCSPSYTSGAGNIW